MINVQIIGITRQTKHQFDEKEVNISFLDDEVQALNAVEKDQPSVILLNYNLRKSETDSYIKLLLSVSGNSKIVVIADELNDDGILSCLTAGARGYQNIKKLNDYIVKMIKVIDAGEAWVTRRMVSTLLDVLMQKQEGSVN